METQILDGRYYISSLLGRGTIADVYSGQDFRLNRDVVVKVLRASLARNPQFFRRFIREAQSVAALSHPNIVAIYATGTHTVTDGLNDTLDVPFIVMEHIKGETLQEHIRRKKMFVRQSVGYAQEILSALDCSHRAGIVHRDVRPANIIIDKARDTVKVTDFGIAQSPARPTASENAVGAPVSGRIAVASRPQLALKTSFYISPEQARGELIDVRSDLYSVAVVLYEMLTSQPPFIGNSAVEIAFRHVSDVPQPPSCDNPDVPQPLDLVVMKALSKNPEDRFGTAADFSEALSIALKEKLGWRSAYNRAALKNYSENQPTPMDVNTFPPSPKPKIFSPKLITAGILITAALLTGAWLAFGQR